jgi:hypothetical protein
VGFVKGVSPRDIEYPVSEESYQCKSSYLNVLTTSYPGIVLAAQKAFPFWIGSCSEEMGVLSCGTWYMHFGSIFMAHGSAKPEIKVSSRHSSSAMIGT